MKERDVRDYFLEVVKQLGGVAKKADPPPKGFPDWVVILPGGYVAFVELKRSEGGVLAKAQQYWGRIIHGLGCNYHLISSKECADAFALHYRQSKGGIHEEEEDR